MGRRTTDDGGWRRCRFALSLSVVCLLSSVVAAPAQLATTGAGGAGAAASIPSVLQLEDGASALLLEDGSSSLCLEGGC
jgi:hypothetical protein